MKGFTWIAIAYLAVISSQVAAKDQWQESASNDVTNDRWQESIANNDVTNHGEDLQCAHQMARVYHDDVITPYPPNLIGEWTSLRCEVRPGPEFLLRKYQFFEDGRFSIVQYYYGESHCKRPVYTLTATGSYVSVQPSWLLAGATEMVYQLDHVRVMPASDWMARLLANKVNATCPSYVAADWTSGRWYDLFSYVEIPDEQYPDEYGVLLEDKDCLSAISFSLHELQLVRLELRKRHRGVEKTLLLGDIHTEPKERRTYRPTGFQEPLAFMQQSGHCPVCTSIINSDEYHAPMLHRRRPAPLELSGSWFSVECETRPHGVFVTRHLSFSDDADTWQGYYHHFLDGRCQRPQFTAHVRGKYAYVRPSRLVDGAHDVDFQVLDTRIKPTDPGVVRSLNEHRRRAASGCGAEPWLLNVEQDLGPTGGCPALGIQLPHTEYELVTIEKYHHTFRLYFGQRPTAAGVFSPSKRPTSFQSALVKCSDSTTMVTPSYGFHTLTIERRSRGAAGSTAPPRGVLLLCAVFLASLK